MGKTPISREETDHREGPPRLFVPVCKHPRDYQYTTGPLGYVEVENVTVGPLLVEPPEGKENG